MKSLWRLENVQKSKKKKKKEQNALSEWQDMT